MVIFHSLVCVSVLQPGMLGGWFPGPNSWYAGNSRDAGIFGFSHRETHTTPDLHICVRNLFQTILRTSGKANWFVGESQSTYSSGRLRRHKKLSDKNTVIKMFTWADSWVRQYSFIALRHLLSSG